MRRCYPLQAPGFPGKTLIYTRGWMSTSRKLTNDEFTLVHGAVHELLTQGKTACSLDQRLVEPGMDGPDGTWTYVHLTHTLGFVWIESYTTIFLHRISVSHHTTGTVPVH